MRGWWGGERRKEGRMVVRGVRRSWYNLLLSENKHRLKEVTQYWCSHQPSTPTSPWRTVCCKSYGQKVSPPCHNTGCNIIAHLPAYYLSTDAAVSEGLGNGVPTPSLSSMVYVILSSWFSLSHLVLASLPPAFGSGCDGIPGIYERTLSPHLQPEQTMYFFSTLQSSFKLNGNRSLKIIRNPNCLMSLTEVNLRVLYVSGTIHAKVHQL